jgi:hypothetical protein
MDGRIKDEVEVIVDNLSRLIMQSLKGITHPQYNPSHSPDLDDAKEAFHRERARALREIRTKFEDTMSSQLGEV